MKQKYKIFFLFAVLLVFSCRTSKIDDGNSLLTKNVYKIDGDKSEKQNLNSYIKSSQKPNTKFLSLFPTGLYLYNFYDKKFDKSFEEYYENPPKDRNQELLDSIFVINGIPEEVGKSKWLARTIHRLGAKPVLIDTFAIELSARNLERFYHKKGFWNAKVTYEVKKDALLFDVDKKKKVIYHIQTGEATKIADIDYNIPNSDILQLYEKYKQETYVKKGDNLDDYLLGKEVSRIEKYMKNNGYFEFNKYKDEVLFYADSTNNKNIPVTLTIEKSQLENNDSTDINFQKSKFGKVFISYKEKDLLPTQYKYDSISGYYLHNPTKEYRDNVFTDAVQIQSGKTYRNDDFINTNRSISSLNNFIIQKFELYKASDSLIDANIVLLPKFKYDFDISFDTFYTNSTNYGITPSLKLHWRNLFGGAENLDLGLNVTVGTLTDDTETGGKFFNAKEYSAISTLKFPRWLLPFKLGKKINPKFLPSTEFYARASVQNNVGLGRINTFAQMNYLLLPNNLITHKITLVNFQYTKVLNPNAFFENRTEYIDILNPFFTDFYNNYPQYGTPFNEVENYRDEMNNIFINYPFYLDELSINNPTLEQQATSLYLNMRRATEDVLIQSFMYEFNYNERNNKEIENPFYLNARVEFSGNLFSLFDRMFNYEKVNLLEKQTSRIFGISYSQFAKFDLDVRKFWDLSSKTEIATRFMFGIAIPYGNSIFLPLDRLYTVGGSNDLRAWYQPNIIENKGLGPGDLNPEVTNRGFGNLKMLLSLEYRFPISTGLNGAIFTDMGNIWETDDRYYKAFSINDFYQQIGIGSGFGFRYNISYFVIRLDFAYKAFDPTLPIEDRWFLFRNSFLQPTVQFGLGYPF